MIRISQSSIRQLKRNAQNKVRSKLKDAFISTSLDFDRSLRETIARPRYWQGFEDSVTHRRNGETVVGAYRNIFDTGNLANSQSVNFNLSSNKLTSSYLWHGNGETPVTLVFFGARTSDRYIPARNWVAETLYDIDLTQMFINNYRS